MNTTLLAAAALAVHPLRALGIDPDAHPRRQPHVSAASGLVCAHGRAYVVSDDEHHLAVFRDMDSPGTLHRILAGDLPQARQARKRLKADLEALCLWPARRALVALGSGSRPNRDTGVVIGLRANGEPAQGVQRFDLKPLYEPLRELLGEINIEGAMLTRDGFVLLNRGITGRTESVAVRYRLGELQQVVDGRRHRVNPRALRPYRLGSIDGVELGFTDGCALPGGGWVFCAAAEATDSSYADGACRGSAVGVVDAWGDVVALHRLASPLKVEGIAARQSEGAIDLCLVTDADDPLLSSQLLRARL
ncbi:MAG TPA: hypothetical protein VFL64_17170 [Rhizobacter sp.]|nr:hypothetical protein [Rhizobacter sp.]